MVTLTMLLAIRMVANSRWGDASRLSIESRLGDSSISSSWVGDSEKNEISLPEMKPDMNRHNNAMKRAMIWPTDSAGTDVRHKHGTPAIKFAGKGSISKTGEFS